MLFKTIRQSILATTLGLLLTSCGGGGDRNESATPTQHYPMGGAIQGTTLTLLNNVSTIAGTVGQTGSTDGPGATALFAYPRFMTTDGTSIYVTEATTVRKLDLSTGQVTTIAGAAGLSGSVDGVGSNARFSFMRGITTDGASLYIVDSANSTIRKMLLSTGVVSTIAGTPGSTGTADGVGAAAQFNMPEDITTDGANLYLTEPYSHTVRKIVVATGQVSTLAGNAGAQGTLDGVGANARFNSPGGITTDGKNVYVLTNFTIRQIAIATGTVTTLAGNPISAGTSDGVGSSAGFAAPFAITSDGANLYVTDLNRVVRKVNIATTTVSTLAGDAFFSGSTDGQGSNARFNYPFGITTDGRSLYVADLDNQTIRKIQ